MIFSLRNADDISVQTTNTNLVSKEEKDYQNKTAKKRIQVLAKKIIDFFKRNISKTFFFINDVIFKSRKEGKTLLEPIENDSKNVKIAAIEKISNCINTFSQEELEKVGNYCQEIIEKNEICNSSSGTLNKINKVDINIIRSLDCDQLAEIDLLQPRPSCCYPLLDYDLGIIGKCTKIKRLELSEQIRLPTNTIERLIPLSKQLENLRLLNCSNLKLDFHHLKHFKKLNALAIGNFYDQSILYLNSTLIDEIIRRRLSTLMLWDEYIVKTNENGLTHPLREFEILQELSNKCQSYKLNNLHDICSKELSFEKEINKLNLEIWRYLYAKNNSLTVETFNEYFLKEFNLRRFSSFKNYSGKIKSDLMEHFTKGSQSLLKGFLKFLNIEENERRYFLANNGNLTLLIAKRLMLSSQSGEFFKSLEHFSSQHLYADIEDKIGRAYPKGKEFLNRYINSFARCGQHFATSCDYNFDTDEDYLLQVFCPDLLDEENVMYKAKWKRNFVQYTYDFASSWRCMKDISNYISFKTRPVDNDDLKSVSNLEFLSILHIRNGMVNNIIKFVDSLANLKCLLFEVSNDSHHDDCRSTEAYFSLKEKINIAWINPMPPNYHYHIPDFIKNHKRNCSKNQ